MALTPEALRTLTSVNLQANPVAVAVGRSWDRPQTDARLAEELREAVRAWTTEHAHYFGPEVADRAAALAAADHISQGAGTVMLTRDHLMAYLHLAART